MLPTPVTQVRRGRAPRLAKVRQNRKWQPQTSQFTRACVKVVAYAELYFNPLRTLSYNLDGCVHP